jgi:hypothetical protein
VYLESSKDILFLVLAFCALWFTAFVCWALYYLISILRDASRTVHDIREKIHAIDEAVRAVRERIENSFGSFGAVATGVRMLGSYLMKRKEKAAEKMREAAKEIKKKAAKIKRKLESEEEATGQDLF